MSYLKLLFICNDAQKARKSVKEILKPQKAAIKVLKHASRHL